MTAGEAMTSTRKEMNMRHPGTPRPRTRQRCPLGHPDAVPTTNPENTPSALNEGNQWSFERLALARARADHLVIAASAMAAGRFAPDARLLDATARLAAALAFDLRVAP
jgi:hypothetical protein